MGEGSQHHAPAALPPSKTRYPLYRRLGRPQGRSGRVWKISPPPGFDPRTVQPVASRCTDWAIPTQFVLTIDFKCLWAEHWKKAMKLYAEWKIHLLGITIRRMTPVAYLKNFRDKWTWDYEISMITKAKPHAGWGDGKDETCFWVERTVPQQRALKHVGRTYFWMQVRAKIWQNRPWDIYPPV